MVQKVIADIKKNAREVLRVELTQYRGHNLASLRVWVSKSDTGELVPTKKGITVAIGLLPAVLDALAEAEREASTAGLCGDG